MEKKYKGVVVAYTDSGILFAKRANSHTEAEGIIFDTVLDFMDNYDGHCHLTNKEDGYGELIIVMTYGEDNQIIFKICFDDEEGETESGGD